MAQKARAPAMDRMEPETLIRSFPILISRSAALLSKGLVLAEMVQGAVDGERGIGQTLHVALGSAIAAQVRFRDRNCPCHIHVERGSIKFGAPGNTSGAETTRPRWYIRLIAG